MQNTQKTDKTMDAKSESVKEVDRDDKCWSN